MTKISTTPTAVPNQNHPLARLPLTLSSALIVGPFAVLPKPVASKDFAQTTVLPMSIANTPSGSAKGDSGETESETPSQDVTWLDGILLEDKEVETQSSGWADPLALSASGSDSGANKQGWLQKTFGLTTKVDQNVEALQRRIQELQMQLQILAARPSVYEMDDSELLAVAGEDAAVLVRAAKAKAQAMLRDAEDRVTRLRDDALAQLAHANTAAAKILKDAQAQADELMGSAKERAAKVLDLADEDAVMTRNQAERERSRVVKEAELRLSEARTQVEQMKNETQERNAELLSRARTEAKAESQSILDDAYAERNNVLERLKSLNERARNLADESTKIRRHLNDLYKDVQVRLNEVLVQINEVDEKAAGLASQTESTTKSI